MLIGQVDGVAEATGRVLENRSDMMVAAILMIAFAAFMLWRDSRDKRESQNRHAAREEADKERQENREREEKVRHDAQTAFNRDMALRNADQLDVMAGALEKTSHATEIMAGSAERTESHLERLTELHETNRRSIVSIIDATDANRRGDQDASTAAIHRARQELVK